MYNSSLDSGYKVSGFVQVPEDEISLQQTLATYGPVWAAVSVTSNWQFISDGTFIETEINPSINHAIAIVGYGQDSNGIQNYIIRNSWSENWGIF